MPVVTVLALSFGGAAFGGWYAGRRTIAKPGEVTFQRLTFRRGEVRAFLQLKD